MCINYRYHKWKGSLGDDNFWCRKIEVGVGGGGRLDDMITLSLWMAHFFWPITGFRPNFHRFIHNLFYSQSWENILDFLPIFNQVYLKFSPQIYIKIWYRMIFCRKNKLKFYSNNSKKDFEKSNSPKFPGPRRWTFRIRNSIFWLERFEFEIYSNIFINFE